MTDSYVRFVVPTRDADSGVEAGIFSRAYDLRDDVTLSSADRATLAEVLAWFREYLPVPKRFNRTRSKGHYRRSPRGIAWFKSSATEHLRQVHRLKAVLEANRHMVTMVREHRLGYIVYEDPYQVIAEPFADTRTGPGG